MKNWWINGQAALQGILKTQRWQAPRTIVLGAVAVIALLYTTACSPPPTAVAPAESPLAAASTPTASPAAAPSPAAASPSPTSPAAAPSPPGGDPWAKFPHLRGTATVTLRVKGKPGEIRIELDGKNAPITAGNFADLVKRGLYDGLMFHRVVRDPMPFVVQGGDPTSKDPQVPITELGMGGFVDPATNQPRSIPLEITPKGAKAPVYNRTFEEAGIRQPPALPHKRGAIAMARSPLPDSASSQFYFALSDLPALDGSYAVFGTVKQGMEIIDQIQAGDRIETATLSQ